MHACRSRVDRRLRIAKQTSGKHAGVSPDQDRKTPNAKRCEEFGDSHENGDQHLGL